MHLDFHHGSRKVLTRRGKYVKPLLVGFIDDRSRYLCHAQWYTHEGTEELVHGLCQALQKVGLPRSLMSDRGAAMIAGEFTAGLHHLGILHLPTLPYSPHVNGKQENLWGRVEGRLLAMLEGEPNLSLEQLNLAGPAPTNRTDRHGAERRSRHWHRTSVETNDRRLRRHRPAAGVPTTDQ
jgi:putative transposase